MLLKSVKKYATIITLLSFSQFSLASSFTIAPTRAEFSQDNDMAIFKLTNDNDYPSVTQVNVKKWLQDANGKDIFSKTNDFIISPMIFKIPPKSTQTIRVLMKTTPDIKTQKTYRLFVEEVSPSKVKNAKGHPITFVIHMNLPLFINPIKNSDITYSWKAYKVDSTHIKLSVTNSGYMTFLISNLNVRNAKKIISKDKNMLLYVLPETTRTITLDTTTPAEGKLFMTSTINGLSITKKIDL